MKSVIPPGQHVPAPWSVGDVPGLRRCAGPVFTTTATTSVYPWPWRDGVTRTRATIPVGLCSSGKCCAQSRGSTGTTRVTLGGRHGGAGPARRWQGLACRHLLWRNRLQAPAAEPCSMATRLGLIFLVTAWQPEVI